MPALRNLVGRSPALTVGVLLLAAIVLMSTVVPLLDPGAANRLGDPLQSPSWSHPAGTDELGRDLFARIAAAGRYDLGIAILGVGASFLIGTFLGTLAGLSPRGWVDGIFMRVVDAFIAFPFTILVLVIVVVVGPERSVGPIPAGLPATFIGLVAISWAWYARLARGQTLSLRRRDHVVASRLIGYSTFRIVKRQLAPSVIRVNAAYAVADATLFVVATASLAFLGAGVQPPTPEWGAIMFQGRAYLQEAWWITMGPGLALALTGLSFSLITDALLSEQAAKR
jgi:peptide/nickel transport system permease protein